MGARLGSARFEPMEVTNRDDDENLSLLCPTDHRVIDGQPANSTATS